VTYLKIESLSPSATLLPTQHNLFLTKHVIVGPGGVPLTTFVIVGLDPTISPLAKKLFILEAMEIRRSSRRMAGGGVSE
jgi:hypothetical protein